MTSEDTSMFERCEALLATTWANICQRAEGDGPTDYIDDPTLRAAISRVVNSSTKSYRYVLPTQLLAKLADDSLDCRCLQVARGGEGAFDARSVCHKVVVPFDQGNENVLGGSPEPYVNNPLRHPEVSPAHQSQQRDRAGWGDLCMILQTVEDRQEPPFTKAVFEQVMMEICKRLESVRVTYPVPSRASFEDTIRVITEYLQVRSGGVRPQALTCALFQTLGDRHKAYERVVSNTINAADASSENIADIECLGPDGDTILAIEVRDRQLTITQVQDKLPSMRAKRVTEMFFVAQEGIAPHDREGIAHIVKKEFAAGQNIYITDLISIAETLLAVMGEAGRRTFLQHVGSVLEQYRCPLTHRRAWAEVLASI